MTRVGDSRGTPLAENQNTLRRSLILHDPEGCAQRQRNTGLAVIGDPGAGKSNRVKLSIEVVLRRGKVDIFDPGTHGEWAQAFRNVTDTDRDRSRRFAIRSRSVADVRLRRRRRHRRRSHPPMIGVPADSDMENRFTRLVSPQMRESVGIGSMWALIGYLRAQPDADNDMLAGAPGGLGDPAGRARDLRRDTAAVFAHAVASHRLADQPAGLARRRRHSQPASVQQTARGARAGMAIYGLITDIVQRHQFLHREQFSTMIFERPPS